MQGIPNFNEQVEKAGGFALDHDRLPKGYRSGKHVQVLCEQAKALINAISGENMKLLNQLVEARAEIDRLRANAIKMTTENNRLKLQEHLNNCDSLTIPERTKALDCIKSVAV
jgi:hypothetical protein